MLPVVAEPEGLAAAMQLAAASGGEYCVSRRLDREMVAAACRSGCMPMGLSIAGADLLLIKSHDLRCVLDFADLHTPASARRSARGLRLEIDRDFRGCLAAIVDAHPDRWLVEPLCRSLESLADSPAGEVQAHSVEVYEGRQLVAGEVGYRCGAVYSSLAAFHRRGGAGSVQLACLGRVLAAAGFAFWDLGMDLEYKRRLGARVLPRAEFLERYRKGLDKKAAFPPGPFDCEGLLRGGLSRRDPPAPR